MIEYEEYRAKYFVHPEPKPQFDFAGLHGATLFYEDYDTAVAFYTTVLGPPSYVEGVGTRSWILNGTWLTLLQGANGNPTNVEVPFVMTTPDEADRLQQAFIDAGGTGPDPIDTIMGVPVRYCPVADPFGVDLLVYSPLPPDPEGP